MQFHYKTTHFIDLSLSVSLSACFVCEELIICKRMNLFNHVYEYLKEIKLKLADMNGHYI